MAPFLLVTKSSPPSGEAQKRKTDNFLVHIIQLQVRDRNSPERVRESLRLGATWGSLSNQENCGFSGFLPTFGRQEISKMWVGLGGNLGKTQQPPGFSWLLGSLGTRDGRDFVLLTRFRTRLGVCNWVRKKRHTVILSGAPLSLNTCKFNFYEIVLVYYISIQFFLIRPWR